VKKNPHPVDFIISRLDVHTILTTCSIYGLNSTGKIVVLQLLVVVVVAAAYAALILIDAEIRLKLKPTNGVRE